MLVSVHENSTVWTLYSGDRGFIKSRLNRAMVDHLQPIRLRRVIYTWFRFAELLQIADMTFVAGQKGWDSLVLLILILAVNLATTLYGYNMHARNWLRREGLETVSLRCAFPGRTELMAVVQTRSTESKVLWMDGIIAPSTRREVLLQSLDAVNYEVKNYQQAFDTLGEGDKCWVMTDFVYAKAAGALTEERLSKLSALESAAC